eukprot:TRINITY_DN7020_c0_g1_i1.p2 TRINITY_DN7020_c0_g1~~TRINITY_DN7020_c0_g1_i1.p2  ORF type:complete len:320 (-),score=41.53 TRINITY_DN7020_c0_g1_i1:261-1220(-)
MRPALYLGKADVAKGEGRKHFEEHGRALVVREDYAGLEGPVRAWYDGLAREHHEPRHVARVVLDPVRKDLEPVQIRGTGASDSGRVAEAVGRNEFGRAGRVVHGLADDVEAELGEGQLALREGLGVADDAGEILLPDAREGEETVVDGELDLADDVEAVAEEEVVVAVDAAAERVLDGEDGAVGDPELDGLESDLELVARDGLAVGVGFAGGGLTVGTGDALVGDAELGAMHRGGREVGDGEGAREVGVDGDEIKGLIVVAIEGREICAVGFLDLLLLSQHGHFAGQDGAGALPVAPAGGVRPVHGPCWEAPGKGADGF